MISLLPPIPCVFNVAALMVTGECVKAGTTDPPEGKSIVLAGIVEAPYTWMGTSPAGNVSRVRCHSGPPTRISDPPWFNQFCNAFN